MTFFEDWTGLVRVVVFAALAYAALIAILRTSGKRTLAQLNIFDWAITVAFGSTLATIILSRDVALAEGLAALASLAALQFAVSWLSTRWPRTNAVFRSDAALLFWNGEFVRTAMRRERISEDEIRQAVRQGGIGDLDEAHWVVLETDGSFTVGRSAARARTSLGDLHPGDASRR